jgi:hypothetical protein
LGQVAVVGAELFFEKRRWDKIGRQSIVGAVHFSVSPTSASDVTLSSLLFIIYLVQHPAHNSVAELADAVLFHPAICFYFS